MPLIHIVCLYVLLKIKHFQKERKVKQRGEIQGSYHLVLPLRMPGPAPSHCIFSYHPHNVLKALTQNPLLF